jgi:hypothetical protein
MRREIKNLEDYRKANNESFASVVRSLNDVNESWTEFSKNSFSRAIEMQAQLAKKAYESYLSEASKLGRLFLAGYGRFVSRTDDLPHASLTSEKSGGGESKVQRTAAHRVATKRKTGPMKHRSGVKRAGNAKR